MRNLKNRLKLLEALNIDKKNSPKAMQIDKTEKDDYVEIKDIDTDVSSPNTAERCLQKEIQLWNENSETLLKELDSKHFKKNEHGDFLNSKGEMKSGQRYLKALHEECLCLGLELKEKI